MPQIARPLYVEAVRNDVCSVCVGFTPSQRNPKICDLELDTTCPVFKRLDKAIQVVIEKGARDASVRDIELIREVCMGCPSANEQGICHVMAERTRTSSWCVLEAYFTRLVGAIEGVHRHVRARPRIPGGGAR